MTLMPDGGTSCVDGSPAGSGVQPQLRSPEGGERNSSSTSNLLLKPLRLPLLSRMSAEAKKKFGSADCVIDGESGKMRSGAGGSGSPASPPMIPRRARRSLPCRAASITDYTAELQLQQNRILTRRQSQPEYVGVAR